MFKAYYDKKRFRFIHEPLQKSGLIRSYRDTSLLKKTGCFYGKKINFYIDTSDGVNEDLRLAEYCGRILSIIKECRGKPFLFFKAAYSPVWSKNIIDLAVAHGGRVIPFFKWSFNEQFYTYTLPRREELLAQKKKTVKAYDIGFGANLKPYLFPKPDRDDPRVGWQDYYNFGIGTGQDQGYYQITSRRDLHAILSRSRFRFWHQEKTEYPDYLQQSFTIRAMINPPGVGEYTSRMFDHTFLGQCLILRKTSYDFGHSWKEYIPEVDFSAPHWEAAVQAILDEAAIWEQKSSWYFENYWSARAIVAYLLRSLEEIRNT